MHLLNVKLCPVSFSFTFTGVSSWVSFCLFQSTWSGNIRILEIKGNIPLTNIIISWKQSKECHRPFKFLIHIICNVSLNFHIIKVCCITFLRFFFYTGIENYSILYLPIWHNIILNIYILFYKFILERERERMRG